jgi:hypothetical protein
MFIFGGNKKLLSLKKQKIWILLIFFEISTNKFFSQNFFLLRIEILSSDLCLRCLLGSLDEKIA